MFSFLLHNHNQMSERERERPVVLEKETERRERGLSFLRKKLKEETERRERGREGERTGEDAAKDQMEGK